MPDLRHCDEYIDDPNAPAALRAWLQNNRRPAISKDYSAAAPTLWATVRQTDKPKLLEFLAERGVPPGTRVRVCMASRFGDVGINTTGEPNGYCARLAVEQLTDFSATKEPPDVEA